MNKRGVAVGVIFVYILGSMFVAAMLLRPKHIVRRANERCVSLGQSADVCKGIVDAMSQAERIEYIRDK